MRAVDRVVWGRPASKPRALESRRARRVYDKMTEKHGPATFWQDGPGFGQGSPAVGQGSRAGKANDFNAGQGGEGGQGPETAVAQKYSDARNFLPLPASAPNTKSPLLAHGHHSHPDHADRPDRANNGKGLGRSGYTPPLQTTLTATLDDWRAELRTCAGLDARREATRRWACALGGIGGHDRIALPAGLPRSLLLAEVKATARCCGLVVEELTTCVRCGDDAHTGGALCEVCSWLGGDRP